MTSDEADEIALQCMDALSKVSHTVRVRLTAAITEDNERCVRELQASRSPTRKLRTGNGATDQAEAV